MYLGLSRKRHKPTPLLFLLIGTCNSGFLLLPALKELLPNIFPETDHPNANPSPHLLTLPAPSSGAGKTQLLLPFLLSTQLSPSHGGISRSTVYISTEHALPTTRLTQILTSHPHLCTLPPSQKPSLNRILTLQTPDLETQEHIITYQLPVAIARHDVGLVVIDSVAANFRAETGGASLAGGGGGGAKDGDEKMTNPQALAHRSTALLRLGALLRDLARKHDCAIVVANQVADRFEAGPAASRALALSPSPPQSLMGSSPPGAGECGVVHSSSATGSQPGSGRAPRLDLEGLLSLDHQLRFFTGWGDDVSTQGIYSFAASQTPSAAGGMTSRPSNFLQSIRPSPLQPSNQNLKTPSLGLVWANQIACRIALIKESASASRFVPSYSRQGLGTTPSVAEVLSSIDGNGAIHGAEWAPRKWRRWVRVVFAPWVKGVGRGEEGVEVEIWRGGVRSLKE